MARDQYHGVVKTALKKDRWVVTDDPFHLGVGGVDMYLDLAAEPLIAAEKDDKRIAVEVKNFLQPSSISEFHTALGQFLNYRAALRKLDSERQLYLAAPDEAYRTFFVLPFIREMVEEYKLQLLIYDPENEEIMSWQK